MAPSVILFTGPPPASSVDDTSCIISHFNETFEHFIGLSNESISLEKHSPSSPSYAAWRALPLARQPLHTGFSQSHDVSNESLWGRPQFFTTADVSFDGDDAGPGMSAGNAEAVLTQFCEQSLAALNTMSASELDSFTTVSDETYFLTTSSAGPVNPVLAPAPISAHLSDLEDIPPAQRITALIPQTVTLNLIVGIISIAQPRTVTTRWGKTMALVELLVGDDTASGFAVTFWLANDQAVESDIRKLRRQDVVLMQNVALHVFRGKVYGQSLHRNMTKVDLLWRRDGGGNYSARALTKREAAGHPQQEKARVVKDWVLKFVGIGADPAVKAKTAIKSWDKPPDDTQ